MDRLPDVPHTAGEKETLAALLDLQRGAILELCEGCSDADLRKHLVPSPTTLLGIVKHLAGVEEWWFHHNFAGRHVDYSWVDTDPNADFRIEPHETTAAILDLYRANSDISRAIYAEAELDDRAALKPDRTLRWVTTRVIWDTARHAGQCDILREQLDGTTGLGFPAPSSEDPPVETS